MVLELTKRSRKSDRLSIAKTLGNLANLYVMADRHAEAESLFKEAVETMENAVGPDHPNYAGSLNNLALFYFEQRRHTDANSLFRRVIKILERALGPNHLTLAAGIENHAVLLREISQHDEAEKMENRANTIRSNYAKNSPGNCGLPKGQPHHFELNTLSRQ